jgi:ribose/xylose/arabinose/galactoside ABC-type transport system permease subunit
MRNNSEGTRGAEIIRDIREKYGMIIILAALLIFFSIAAPNFLNLANFSRILIGQVFVGFLAAGALFILIIGEFDISIGYILGCTMCVGGFLAKHGFGFWPILFAMLATGVLAGYVNGVLVVHAKISSPIATLGVGIVLYGITYGLSDGRVLSENIPTQLIDFAKNRLFEIPYPVFLFLAIGVVLCFILAFTPFGRYLYAIGGSERASFLSGVNSNMLRIVAFILAGFFAAVCAVVLLGQASGANPQRGPEYLMSTYAVAFVSVTVFKPGVYNMPGVLLALYMLGIGFNGLSMLGTPFWFESLFYGIVLIFAVLFASNEARKAATL